MRPDLGRISAMSCDFTKFPRFRVGQQPKLREMVYYVGVVAWLCVGRRVMVDGKRKTAG
jgi:hypothetical protein